MWLNVSTIDGRYFGAPCDAFESVGEAATEFAQAMNRGEVLLLAQESGQYVAINAHHVVSIEVYENTDG